MRGMLRAALVLGFGLVVFSAAMYPASDAVAQQQQKKAACKSWQHKDKAGQCVDNACDKGLRRNSQGKCVPADCKPWQQRNAKEECVDRSDATVHRGPYEPQRSETCWLIQECLCHQYEFPGAESCGPCQLTGEHTTCIPD